MTGVRPAEFIGSSKDDLSSFPEQVRVETGHILWEIQRGKTHPNARPMRGKLRDVIEISVDDELGSRTFRTTCTVRIGDIVYVLHAFLKKSKLGISTPKRHLDLIERRLKEAWRHYEKSHGETK